MSIATGPKGTVVAFSLDRRLSALHGVTGLEALAGFFHLLLRQKPPIRLHARLGISPGSHGYQLDRCICLLYTYSWAGAMNRLDRCTGFEWDEGNRENWIRHRVSAAECEQVFFNIPFLVAEDEQHSGSELRYYVLGQTDAGRRLFVAITVRRELVRVISARDMSRRERKEYEDAGRGTEKDTKV